MKSLSLFIVLILGTIAAYGSGNTPAPPPQRSLDAISADDAKKHVYFLAADSMQGRNTPSPQLEIAARYIADRFKEYGLQPLNGSYLYPYHISRSNLDTNSDLRITLGNTKSSFRLKSDWDPLEMTAGSKSSGEASGDITGNIVFAGYGITAPEYKYDDYKNIDATGKIVFILRHEPREKSDDTTVFKGRALTKYSTYEEKIRNAIMHGASGLLICTDPLNHLMLTPEGYPWPSVYFKKMKGSDIPIQLDLDNGHKKTIPAAYVGEAVIDALFGSVDSLTHLQARIDSTLTPNSFDFKDASCDMHVIVKKETITVHDVVGWLPGTERDSEHIIIGGHYDHLGTKHATSPGEDTIYNGADDNASGTTGVLETARAFCAAGKKPERSVLFIAFSGEEKGLFGSRAYAANPLVPLEKCDAMLNMDMIGRNAPDTLELGGGNHSPELEAIAREQNKDVGFVLTDGANSFFDRSDQASFAEKGIPVLFFFTGEHKDYHQVTDSPDKINYEKLARVATLCFRTAWYIADGNSHFAYIEHPAEK
ncbi:MAG TPA: M20/M25/M40 family metallo-hydrolase [Candidatus Kapabacteria bacterium]|nr:M20/M25/M40 family metallo-hydrolase [Candidatus Kapabacteria bacterium]